MLFSIIMPVYMVEDYIEKSVQSIIDQTYRDFEIILVDDGTKDGSIKRGEKILENSDIKYSVITQKNMGVSLARNAGIKSAEGDWIICIDPDDCIHPQTLEFVKEIIEKEQSGPEVIGFNYSMYSNQEYHYPQYNCLPGYDIYPREEAARLHLSRKLHLISPALFIQRKICIDKDFFYDPDVIYSEDTLYIWNVILNSETIYYINLPLYYYLTRPQSTMTSSKIGKILNGYRAYLEFGNKIQKWDVFDEQKYIVPRWILGVMHSTSKYMDFGSYRELLKALDYRKYMKELRQYRNKKVRMAVWVICILKSPSFFILRLK